jgi:hypothetical protein
MTVIELLDGLISDMTDNIHDYEDDIRRTYSRIEKYEKNIRADELRTWRKILRVIREEQS